MKKTLFLLIALISVISIFTSCKRGNTSSTPINITKPADVNQPTDTTTEPADKATSENTTNLTDTAHLIQM